MIVSFGLKETRLIWEGQPVSSFSFELQRAARRKLRLINQANNIVDLIQPPSDRLEKLKGDLDGFYSIRVNLQWRIVFRWQGVEATDVEIIDYH